MDMQVLVRWMVGKLLKEDRLLGGGETSMGREIELVRDRLLSGIVCCDVDPASEGAFDEVDRLCRRLYNGTTGGWRTLRKEGNLCESTWDESTWDEVKPVPCKEHQNRWHYVVIT